MRRVLLAVAFVAAVAAAVPADDKTPAPAAAGYTPLFNGKDLTGWVNVNTAPGTFFVKGNEIVTTGTPTGFLRTDKQYENFELEFEWMHVEKEKMANSGLFVWGDPLPAVGTGYTRGIEVQVLINYAPKDGWATSHGDIFSIWGAKCTPDRPHFKGIERCLPSENRVKGGGEWNHYKVIANDGAIKLHVNGKEVSGVSKCTPRKGYLALESEGVECHFKNIKIKELPSTNPKPEECAKLAEGHVSIFDGVDLKGWDADPKAWKAADGRLVAQDVGRFTTDSAHLTTGKKYGPFELVFDWKLPAKGAEQKLLEVEHGAFRTVIAPDGVTRGDLTKGKVPMSTTGNKVDLKPGAFNRGVLAYDGKKYTLTVNGKPGWAWEPDPAGEAPLRIRHVQGLELMNLFVREPKK